MRAVAVTALALPMRAESRLKKAPSAVSVRPTLTAASRRCAEARLSQRRVRDERILPSEILLLGAKPSQEVKCFALGQAERSSPHSAMLQREVRTETVDLGDVLSEQREERRADIEGQCVRLIGSGPT